MNRAIDAATWSRLNPLIDAALDLPQHERAAWLMALPPQHQDLKALLQELLDRHAAHTKTGTLLRELPVLDTRAVSAIDALASQHAAGERIGPYRLLRELGVGGMGSVWLTERVDGLMAQRQVALKLPFGPFQGDLAARIAREREILATLDHPHIARLYDAGVSDSGQPYLALEHVDGDRIDRYCERERLDVPARLRLFLQAARAVAQAHAQLIVHRDIKPSNLMVDAAGQVKLLDFGIARLLEASDAPARDVTQQGRRPLTPDYASPEQIAGGAVDTRTDVYALGVLLFELLTGARPYRLKRDSGAALEEAILAAEVQRPSEVAGGKALRRALRGDLDTIVLKALKKSVNERYASADALTDDIERHLSTRPVLARPDSLSYRVRKFIARNRVGVATASAVLLAVIGGAGAAAWQAHVAIAERQRAEDVKDFVAAIFREASPYAGSGTKDLTAIDLLKQADKKLEAAAIGPDSVRLELSNMIGASLLALGDVAAAEPIVMRSVSQAQHRLLPLHPQTVRALYLRSQVHRMRGRPQQASDDMDAVLPTLRQRVDTANGVADLANALLHRTGIALDLGAYVAAERLAQEGFVLTQSRLAERDPERVASAVVLAQALRFTKKFDLALVSAERAYREALALYGEAVPHRRMAEARSVYGRALADTGDLARGIAMLETSVADQRAMLGPKSNTAGIFLQNIVAYRMDLGELELAEANAVEALEILGSTMARDAPAYVIAEHSLAAVRLARRRAPAAFAGAAHAADVLDRTIGAGHENAIAARTTKALALLVDGRLDEAARETNVVAPLAAALVPSSQQVARVALARGTLARLQGDNVGALQHLRPLVDSVEPSPKWQRERMRGWTQIGLVQLEQRLPAEALVSFDRALKEFDRLETRMTPARADALVGRARAHLAQNEPALALPLLEQADRFWRGFDPASPSGSAVSQWLAQARAASRG